MPKINSVEQSSDNKLNFDIKIITIGLILTKLLITAFWVHNLVNSV